MFGNTTPEYVCNLLNKHTIEEETLISIFEDDDELTDQTFESKIAAKVRLVYTPLKSIRYKEILEGLGNYEQAREPSIGQAVYFIILTVKRRF